MAREIGNVKRLVDEDLLVEALLESLKDVANDLVSGLNEVRQTEALDLPPLPGYDLASVKAAFRAKVDVLADLRPAVVGGGFPDVDLPDATQGAGAQFNSFGNASLLPGGAGYIAVYRKGGSHIGDRGEVWGITSVDGVTWGPEFLIYTDPVLDSRDPCIMLTTGGDLYITMVLYHPTNGLLPNANRVLKAVTPGNPSGTVWTETPANSTFTGFEACSAPLVEMPNGDLLFPMYGKNTGDTFDSSRVLRSVDGGETWAELAVLAAGVRIYHEPCIVRLDNGTLYALLRTGGVVYKSTSADDGATWSTPVAVYQGIGAPRFSQLGNGVLVTNYRASDHSTAVRWSSDRGATWSAEAIIDNRGSHHYGGFVPRSASVAMLVYWRRDSGTISRGHVTHVDLTGLGVAP